MKPKVHGSQHHDSETGAKAEGSVAETEKSKEPKSETSEEPESESTAGGTGGGGHSSGGNGGHHSGGNKSNAQPEGKVGPAEKVPSPTTKHASASSGGSSSPVVPILIAVAVLAAISIGVVLYRQRKDDSGSGPDRRVSSPNAS